MILLGNTEAFETISAELKSRNKLRHYLIIFPFDYKIYKASISEGARNTPPHSPKNVLRFWWVVIWIIYLQLSARQKVVLICTN